jgi:integrase
VRLLKQEGSERRPAKLGVQERLIASTEDRKRLLLVHLHYQGWRISETLGLDWQKNVDLSERAFNVYIPKVKQWKWVPMHDAVFEEYSAVPESERYGRVFPWLHRNRVYYWLNPLCKRLGVDFTPHMARHAYATSLNDLGASSHHIAASSTWTSVKSVDHYITVDQDRTREVINRRKIGGRIGGERRKAL